MKAIVKIHDCKVYDLVKNSMDSNNGKDKVEWTSLFFRQGNEMNTVTVDKDVVSKIKPMVNCTLVCQITEQTKNNFTNSKFKVIGIEDIK